MCDVTDTRKPEFEAHSFVNLYVLYPPQGAPEARGDAQQSLGPARSASSAASQLEALLLGAGNLPGMLDLPPDADDEAMMELAIALSLQEQSASSGLNLQALSLSGQQGQSSLSLEGGNSSGTGSGKGCKDLNVNTAYKDLTVNTTTRAYFSSYQLHCIQGSDCKHHNTCLFQFIPIALHSRI